MPYLYARELDRRHLGATVTIKYPQARFRVPLLSPLDRVVFRPDGVHMFFGDGSVVPVPPDTTLIVQEGHTDGMV